ncbi:hypothetical protein ACOMHN_054122 [Nucella lapillus]
MSMKQRPANSPSMLLHSSENDTLFNVIGRGCVTLASGVVQLYLADQPDRVRWNKRCCGVACFVKDNPKRSYFIRVYDVKKGQQIWEQELYNQFRYKTPREYFHTFEGHSCVVGLNFASEDEALKFQNAVDGKLQERATRRREKKRQGTMHGQPPARPPNNGQCSLECDRKRVGHWSVEECSELSSAVWSVLRIVGWTLVCGGVFCVEQCCLKCFKDSGVDTGLWRSVLS